jgi:Arc/MetJ-type ribon-helix-helix transcriptional regulator
MYIKHSEYVHGLAERWLFKVVLWKPTSNINLALPEELLADIDEAAKQNYMSRTAYIRQVLHKAISERGPGKRYKPKGDEPWLYDLDDS